MRGKHAHWVETSFEGSRVQASSAGAPGRSVLIKLTFCSSTSGRMSKADSISNWRTRCLNFDFFAALFSSGIKVWKVEKLGGSSVANVTHTVNFDSNIK